MTPGRRRLLTLGGILLVVGITAAILASLTMVVLPLALGLGLVVCTSVVALGRRSRRRPGSKRAGSTAPARDHTGRADLVGSRRPSTRRWARRWQSGPPTEAVPDSRRKLTVVLAEWGLAGEAIEPALMVVTELLSNAIDHGRSPVQLAVEYSGGQVHIEVHDSASDPPQRQPHDPLRVRGRGLQMVEALSSRWGWREEPPGKAVWADVPTEWPTSDAAATITR